MEKISIFDIIFSKDDQLDGEESARSGRFFSREFSGSITKRLKRILSSNVFRWVKEFSYLISHIPTSIYGIAILTFGLASTLIYFLHLSSDTAIITPVLGILLAVFSIPFLLSDKPLPVMLQDFEITDYLFYEFFCMKRHSALENVKRFPPFVAVIIGFIPAILSVFLPLWQVVLGIAIIICIYIGIESPEFLYLFSLASLPFLKLVPYGDIALAATLLLATLSFFIKVLYGKRVVYIEQYDIFIGAMLLFILISGIFVKGTESFSGSMRMIIFALGYILAGNIITNRRLAERSANSIIVSSSIATLVSLGQLIALFIKHEYSLTDTHLVNLLAREDGMTVFFIVSAIFSIGMIKHSTGIAFIAYIVSAVLNLCGLVLTGEVFALFTLVIAAIAYALLKMNKLIGILLPILICLPLSILLLPNAALNLLFSYSPSISSAEELFVLWQNSLELFFNNIFVGIGIGSESFADEMAAFGGSFGYVDSSNLLLELGLEAGAFALIFFVLIIFTRIRHRASRYLYLRNSEIESVSIIAGVTLCSLISFGMVNYIWSDASAYYLFWCIFGIGSATLRIAKKDYDDRVLYYEETSAQDSSVIDIEIG